MRFARITDCHFTADNAPLFQTRPRERLAPLIEAINRDHSDVAFVLITGDLVEDGSHQAYQTLRSALAPLIAPVHLMLGNHDRRGPFAEVFDEAHRDANGFVQFAVEGPDARLICLDTLDEGAAAGRLCPDRLAWLREELSATPDDKALAVAMHHPPLDLGLPAMDRIRLKDDAALAEVFDSIRRPDLLLIGHVHRPVSGHWRGAPFHIQRGINHQVAMDFTDRERIIFSDEAPEYSIVDVTPERALVLTRAPDGERRTFGRDPDPA